jgi:hypothetical protein
MKWRNFTCDELYKGIAHKLDLEQSETRQRSPHPVYWYVLDGRKVLRITLPNRHGGAEAISTGFLQQIKRSLRLTTRQFEDLVSCLLTAEEYEQITRKQTT